MKEDALAVFRRRKIGFVFQAFNLVSSVNVWENIVLPLGLDGRKVDEAYVNDIIATLGIENRIYNLSNQLSGGQKQRVAIARALVNRPEIIFAVISIMVVLMSIAIAIYFGKWIKSVLSINLILLLLLVQVIYIGIRCYVKDWREERGYY